MNVHRKGKQAESLVSVERERSLDVYRLSSGHSIRAFRLWQIPAHETLYGHLLLFLFFNFLDGCPLLWVDVSQSLLGKHSLSLLHVILDGLGE